MADHPDLPSERVANQDYLDGLAKFLAQRVEIGTSRSRTWLDEEPVDGKAQTRPGCLAGRVALDVNDPDLGREFYIGVRHLSDRYFPHPVVGWDAPVAKIFYDPEGAEHELLERVRVRRTMLSSGLEITRLDDEWDGIPSAEARPFSAPKLQIAQPPSPAGSRSRSRQPRSAPLPPPSGESTLDRPSVEITPSAPPVVMRPLDPSPRAAAPRQPATDTLREGMRSVAAVEHALVAPRKRSLTSVLATLQPDQYRLVTRAGNRPLVVQGHPGTGKTIVAVHRAAYLVSPERKRNQEVGATNVLFLGPSNTWALHVSKAVRSLAEGDIEILAVPTLLTRAIGLSSTLQGGLDYAVDEVDPRLFSLASAVTRIVSTTEGWVTGKHARKANVAAVYSAIRYGATVSRIGIQIPDDLRSFASALPRFESALSQRTLQPFMAAIAIAVYGAHTTYDHIIVDEAQDVSPLTWEVIKAHSEGGMTIVGDMNQRRNDVGYSSWSRVVQQLGLRDGDHPTVPDVMNRGYRSTQEILNFAKALLPVSERDVQSLQGGGAPPVVRRAGSARARNMQVEAEATRFCETYPRGQVAVIVLRDQLDALETHFLKAGWRRGMHHVWSQGAHRLKIVTPTTARGVEFDAVVVVEPGDFPRNVGRVGQLYTSLTRANRELAVVHHKALPDELRRYERRR